MTQCFAIALPCGNVLDSYTLVHGVESCSNQMFLFHAAAILLCCTKNYFSEVVYFFKTYYRTPLYVPVESGASVDPTS
jgi:hypothetical protein